MSEPLDSLNQQLQSEIAKRKAAQQTVEELSAQFELLLSSMSEGVQRIDLEGRIVFSNAKAAELLRWPREALLGRFEHETIHYQQADGRAYPPENCPIHASVAAGGPIRVTNDVFWRKDGTPLRVAYLATPITVNNGRVIGILLTFRSIESNHSDPAPSSDEQHYRSLFQSSPVPTWVVDAKSLSVRAVNDAAISRYGYSRDEFLKLKLADLEAQQLNRSFASAEAQANFTGVSDHVRIDGTRFTVAVYSTSAHWNGGAARIVTAIDWPMADGSQQGAQSLKESASDRPKKPRKKKESR